jgi:hypothetical protein
MCVVRTDALKIRVEESWAQVTHTPFVERWGGRCGWSFTAGLSRIRWPYCGSKDRGTTEEARKISRREDSKHDSADS